MVGKEISHGLWLYWNRAHTQTHYSGEPRRLRLHVKHSWIFPLYFQLHHLPGETCFQQAGSYAVGRNSQALLGSSDNRKVLASLSIILKSEKIRTLIQVGKGRPFHEP